MSRKGKCLDNAPMESFFGALKTACIARFRTWRETKTTLFEYIEVFYNRQSPLPNTSADKDRHDHG